ncbi:MAG TPA: hypothetical protein VLB80_02955 [Candidatus Babeliales bacterium]|nr:hypothetical protein [Candidatus Babeliales bacterium]
MYPYDIVFVLNDTYKLVVNLEQPFEQLPCYCQMTISFYEDYKEYVLNFDEDLESSMDRFVKHLTKVLHNDFFLHESIKEDIGYLHNEYLKYALDNKNDEGRLNPDLVYEGEFDNWVGEYYQLWSYRQCAAWMYNDSDGAIIFSITPRYQGFFDSEEKLVTISSYEEWIKSYKPIIVCIISREIAYQWLEQAHKILTYIQDRFNVSIKDKDDNKIIYEDCPRN